MSSALFRLQAASAEDINNYFSKMEITISVDHLFSSSGDWTPASGMGQEPEHAICCFGVGPQDRTAGHSVAGGEVQECRREVRRPAGAASAPRRRVLRR